MKSKADDALAAGWEPLLETARPWELPETDILVVAPHPDDESLATGGMLARQARRHRDAIVLAVTDGESAYSDRADRAALARVRRNEQRKAVTALGLQASSIWRVGVPDGAVARHERMLSDLIERLCVKRDIGTIVAPWTNDFHTDHEACGRAALSAAQRLGRPIAFSLFWALHRVAEPDLDQVKPRALLLTMQEFEQRRRAVRCHRSQTEGFESNPALLGSRDLASTEWSSEYYLTEIP